MSDNKTNYNGNEKDRRYKEERSEYDDNMMVMKEMEFRDGSSPSN